MKKLFTLLFGLIISILMVSAQVDTTGLSAWPQLYNSMSTWDEGSFNMNQKGHPDYGWGVYNSQNHNVDGDSIFVIKGLDGDYRALYISMKYSSENRYDFRYANLDFSNEIFEGAPCYNYTDKLFLYYDFATNSIVDREPDIDSWDFVLTKYHENIINYPAVTGLLLNETATACVYDAADSTMAFNAILADTTSFSDSLTIIGNSWYELQGMSIVPLNNKAYFIKIANGAIFRLNVTYFESGYSGEGRVGIRYQQLSPEEGEAVNDTLTMGAMYANDVYFGLSNGTSTPAARDNWDIAFKTNAFSASILTNTTMGVELYAYPKADETAWDTYGIEDKAVEDASLIVYPNPVSDVVYLRSDKFVSGKILDISILDITGREVMRTRRQADGEISLDLGDLNSGSYLIKVTSADYYGVTRIVKTN
ncbi:MAG TPA: T9SS type A sorting domain-containing protein [Bacteroidales bacterium]|nr:T9SS type A sorting domain-containing protein [Bacteroidales bacterium]